MCGDNEVEYLPAGQRIVDEMALGAGPQCRRVPADILGHLAGRNDRTIGRVPGDPRRTVPDQLLAHVRPQAIRADEPDAAVRRAGGELRRHVFPVLLVADDLAVDLEPDARVLPAGAQEDAMEIAAVHHRVGILEPRAKRVAEIDVDDFFAGERVHQPQRVDIDRHLARDLAHPERVEAMKRVGAELDAGADFA